MIKTTSMTTITNNESLLHWRWHRPLVTRPEANLIEYLITSVHSIITKGYIMVWYTSQERKLRCATSTESRTIMRSHRSIVAVHV